MTAHLFVYGSLMRAAQGFGQSQRAKLAGQSVSHGAAQMRGRLYDLGDYPGLVLEEGETGLVQGELVELADPAMTFAWLDRYESIDPAKPDSNEYDRVIQDAFLHGAGRVATWVYIYKVPHERHLPEAQLIKNGSWLHRRERNV